MPPNYNDLPKPGKIQATDKANNTKIDKMLKMPREDANASKSSSIVEQSIINEIGK